MPQIVVRIPEEMVAWLGEHYPARGDVSRLVRSLLEKERLNGARIEDVGGGSLPAVKEGSGVKPSVGTRTPPAPPKSLIEALQESVAATKAKKAKATTQPAAT